MDGLNTALEFLSTPSVRKATCQTDSSGGIQMNFYPRPPRGGRQLLRVHGAETQAISIHALREEGDLSFQGLSLGQHNFYPRPP